MRLLQLGPRGGVTLTEDLLAHEIPPYAILSHTWGSREDEVTLQDLTKKKASKKRGYKKIIFCGQQAQRDGLEYFWVDTCCIDKTSSAELTEAINSMFVWYEKAHQCYVFLADVPHNGSVQTVWERSFRDSRWFTRGWTLQELIAPRSVIFFSSEGHRLGDKNSLDQIIHEITQIPVQVLQGHSLADFSSEERISWGLHRKTTRAEDKAYSLLGILGIYMPLVYGEGDQAFERLRSVMSGRQILPRLVKALPTVEEATFNSHAEEHNPRCLPGTRVSVLEQISGWTENAQSQAIYWLNGMAGTGKSTISRTLAHEFSKNGTLGATFFFKRGEGDRSSLSKFFTTLACQLVERLPEIAVHVQNVVDNSPGIFSRAMQEQFDKLILQPLSTVSAMTAASRTFVFIIDALDECEREEDAILLINLFANARMPQSLTLKIFLTSRPELAIRLGFDEIHGKYEDFILHEISEAVIGRDIATFLEYELNRVRQKYNGNVAIDRQIPHNWPEDADFQELVKMASPLFIFAATVCRFIADRRGGNPDRKLRKVLEYLETQGSRLNATYMPVLEHLLWDQSPREKKEFLQHFRTIVGSVVLLADPLSASAISRLIGIELQIILDLLDHLHSTLSVPSSSTQPVKLLHLSFRDFLIDPERRGDSFWINEQQIHHYLAMDCLRMMDTSLRADICSVKEPGTRQASMTSARICKELLPEVQYACRFWSYHLKEARASVSEQGEIWSFLSSHFLHWLEALGWLGRASESVDAIKVLQSLPQEGDCQKISEFLDDAFRFVLGGSSFYQPAPLQVYLSSIVFAPRLSIVRLAYDKDVPKWLMSRPDVPITYGQTLHTLEGHSVTVTAVAFSPDGQLMASASEDCTVRLWTVDTGAPLQVLEGHSAMISSTMFSPDSRLLVSGSIDCTVRLWEAKTGSILQVLNDDRGEVHSVAFSSDGQAIVAAFGDGTVRLWETNNGTPLMTFLPPEMLRESIDTVALSPGNRTVAAGFHNGTMRFWAADTNGLLQECEGHSSGIESVAISPDGRTVASASQDSTVRLWAADTGALLHTLEGHSAAACSVAFSPDGRMVASGSSDRTVRIWAADTGVALQMLPALGTFGVHSAAISSIAFSPDSRLVAAALRDGTVRLWTVNVTELPYLREGHSSWVNSVAISPDGLTVASASQDCTVRLWAADTGDFLHTLEGHTDAIDLIVISADSRMLASASQDCTIRLWAVDTGALLQTLQGHTGAVGSVVFAADGRTVGSASQDCTVRLWAADTGALLHILEGHTDAIDFIAISADGQMLASASQDCTIRLWAVDTGALLQTLQGHTGAVGSVVFAADGRTVGSASQDCTVRLWAVDTGVPLQVFKGHNEAACAVAFSSDSSTVASASHDRTVRLWDASSGKLLQILNIGVISETLGVNNIDRTITTCAGTFAFQDMPNQFTPHHDRTVSILANDKSLGDVEQVSYGISRDQGWITRNGKDILRLPADCRPGVSTTLGSTVVIGSGSGRVLILHCEDSLFPSS